MTEQHAEQTIRNMGYQLAYSEQGQITLCGSDRKFNCHRAVLREIISVHDFYARSFGRSKSQQIHTSKLDKSA